MKNFWKNKRVLITGGAGFIGSNMTKELVKRGSDIVITVSESSSNKETEKIFGELLKNIKVKKVDLLNLNDCLIVLKDIDIVLNLAALDGGAKFKKEHSGEIYKVNTTIVKNILEAAILNNVERVLLMSSIEIYSKSIGSVIREIDADMNIKRGYVGSKVYSEKLAKKYHDKYGLKIAIARSGNVYGSGDTINPKRARVIPTFISEAIKGKDIEISNSSRIAFLHVSDLINALLDLTEKYSVCDPVNLVSAKVVSLNDLAKIIIRICKSKSKVINKSKGLTQERVISIEKAKKIINFKEKIDLEKGLRLLVGV